MPTIDFDGHALHYGRPDRPVDDTSVAVTLHELRTLMALLPDGDALPVASRGDLLVLMPGSHTLPYIVALARMRPAVDAETPENGAQMAQEPAPAPDRDARLTRLADDFQGLLERVLDKLEVDPVKHDHQNHAGDVTGALFAILRRHGLLEPEPEPTARPGRQDVRAAVARGLAHTEGMELEQISAVGRAVMAELEKVLPR